MMQRAGFDSGNMPESLARLVAGRSGERITIGRSGDQVVHLHGTAAEPGAYLKIARHRMDSSLRGESERIEWLADRLAVPAVLLYAEDAEHEYLLLREVPGMHAAHPDGTTDRHRLIATLAQGLHQFHCLPTSTCPFDSRFSALLEQARRRVANGLVNAGEFDDEYRTQSAEQLIDELEHSGFDEDHPVVLHGDYSLPNVMMAGGRISGFIDLGSLGVGDRHRDLVCAAWSITYNFGEAYLPGFFEAYGPTHFDPERFRLHRMLNQLL